MNKTVFVVGKEYYYLLKDSFALWSVSSDSSWLDIAKNKSKDNQVVFYDEIPTHTSDVTIVILDGFVYVPHCYTWIKYKPEWHTNEELVAIVSDIIRKI